MNWLRLATRTQGRYALTATLAAGFVLVGSVGFAQQSSALYDSDPNVTVDMSVLDGGSKAVGGFNATIPSFSGSGRRLLVPGSQAPVSRLLVPRPGSPLSKTFAQGAMQSVTPTPPTAQAEPMPAEPSTAPAPEQALRPQVVMAPSKPAAPVPAPKSAPRSQVVMAPSKPVAPAPAPKPAPVVKPASAPKPAPKQQMAVVTPPKPAPKPVAKAETKPIAQPKPHAPKPAPTVSASSVPAPPPPPPPNVSTPKPPQVASAAPTQPRPEKVKPASASGTVLQDGDMVSLLFPEAVSKMPQNETSKLGPVIASLSERSDYRIRLFAYAGGDDLTKSKARRLSLSRALDVRSYLMKNGVRSTRIDVRALGSKTDKTPVNRVDDKHRRAVSV